MPMAKRDIIASLVLLAFATWYAWLTTGVPARSAMPDTPGPTFFPWLLDGLLFVLSAALLVRGLVFRKRAPHQEVAAGVAPLQIALFLGSFLIYLAVLPYAGFVIATIPFVAVLVWLFGCRTPLQVAACAFGLTIVTYVVFRYGFEIVLPRGPLPF